MKIERDERLHLPRNYMLLSSYQFQLISVNLIATFISLFVHLYFSDTLLFISYQIIPSDNSFLRVVDFKL